MLINKKTETITIKFEMSIRLKSNTKDLERMEGLHAMYV